MCALKWLGIYIFLILVTFTFLFPLHLTFIFLLCRKNALLLAENRGGMTNSSRLFCHDYSSFFLRHLNFCSYSCTSAGKNISGQKNVIIMLLYVQNNLGKFCFSWRKKSRDHVGDKICWAVATTDIKKCRGLCKSAQTTKKALQKCFRN